jgi:hypothetical protein
MNATVAHADFEVDRDAAGGEGGAVQGLPGYAASSCATGSATFLL